MSDMISNCCSAPIISPMDEIGICTKCKEWAQITYEACPECGAEWDEEHERCTANCQEIQ